MQYHLRFALIWIVGIALAIGASCRRSSDDGEPAPRKIPADATGTDNGGDSDPRDTGATDASEPDSDAASEDGASIPDSRATDGGPDGTGGDARIDSGEMEPDTDAGPDASGSWVPCCSSICQYSTKSHCQSQGNTPKPGTTCAANPCSGSQLGACCVQGLGCFNMTQSQCSAGGGNFNPNSSCSNDPCMFSTGACCQNGGSSCLDSTMNFCTGSSSTFRSGQNCASNPC